MIPRKIVFIAIQIIGGPRSVPYDFLALKDVSYNGKKYLKIILNKIIWKNVCFSLQASDVCICITEDTFGNTWNFCRAPSQCLPIIEESRKWKYPDILIVPNALLRNLFLTSHLNILHHMGKRNCFYLYVNIMINTLIKLYNSTFAIYR